MQWMVTLIVAFSLMLTGCGGNNKLSVEDYLKESAVKQILTVSTTSSKEINAACEAYEKIDPETLSNEAYKLNSRIARYQMGLKDVAKYLDAGDKEMYKSAVADLEKKMKDIKSYAKENKLDLPQ